MIAIAAIDLLEGACVQLVGGDFGDVRVRLPDPLRVQGELERAGFARLHVVDLGAAGGLGSSAQAVRSLLGRARVPVQVGGGIRDEEAVAFWLDAGADRVVVGTRAVEDPAWLAAVAHRFPGRLVVAADVRERQVVVRGWSQGAGPVQDLMRRLSDLPLAGVLVTAVHLEGRLQGPDLELTRDLASSTTHSIIASGGIRSKADLHALAEAGAAAGVVGMALYTGKADPRQLTRELP